MAAARLVTTRRRGLVGGSGIEPLTFAMSTRRSPAELTARLRGHALTAKLDQPPRLLANGTRLCVSPLCHLLQPTGDIARQIESCDRAEPISGTCIGLVPATDIGLSVPRQA